MRVKSKLTLTACPNGINGAQAIFRAFGQGKEVYRWIVEKGLLVKYPDDGAYQALGSYYINDKPTGCRAIKGWMFPPDGSSEVVTFQVDNEYD